MRDRATRVAGPVTVSDASDPRSTRSLNTTGRTYITWKVAREYTL
jgi:hypothetical protein